MLKKIILILAIISLIFIPIYHIEFCEGELYGFEGAYVKYSLHNSSMVSVKYLIKNIDGSDMIVSKSIHYDNGTWENSTYNDNLNDPNYFPVISSKSIGKKNLTFLNTTFKFKEKKDIKINGKNYHTLVYTSWKIDEILTIYVDSSTGIIVKGTDYTYIAPGKEKLLIAEIDDTNINERSCIPLIIALASFLVFLGIFLYLYIRDRKIRLKENTNKGY